VTQLSYRAPRQSDTAPTIDVRWPRPDVAQVVLEGEHDMATKDQLDTTLATSLANCSHLIVDLSTTLFIDSSTIRVLITSKERADAAGRRFNLLLGTEPIVERALEITGVLPALNRIHALEEAIPNTPPWPARASPYV
jgi:anti-anti-sigma factor